MDLRHFGDTAAVPDAAPLSARQHIVLSTFWFSLNFQSAALLPVVIPTQILLFVSPGAVGDAQQATFLGWFAALGTVVAVVAQPATGLLSDRTRGPLGRRRPYIAIGGALLLLGAFELAAARALVGFALGFLVMQLGGSVATAAYQGLVPDLVPAEQRGTTSGYIGLMTILGNVGSLAVAGILFGQVTSGVGAGALIERGAGWYYALSGLVLSAGLAVTLLRVHETPLAEREDIADDGGIGPSVRPSWRTRLARTWLDPWRHRNFTWVFLTRGAVMMGLALFMTFIGYYFANVAHVPSFALATAVIALLALLGAASSALFLGVLSDRIGRVPLVCASTACMALAALAFVVAPDRVPLWPLGIVFGVGYGAYSSVDWALAIDALPSPRAAGKDMGLWSISTTLPAVLAPPLGGLVIAAASGFGALALGYRLVFALAVLFFVLGAACILFVRERPRGGTISV